MDSKSLATDFFVYLRHNCQLERVESSQCKPHDRFTTCARSKTQSRPEVKARNTPTHIADGLFLVGRRSPSGNRAKTPMTGSATSANMFLKPINRPDALPVMLPPVSSAGAVTLVV